MYPHQSIQCLCPPHHQKKQHFLHIPVQFIHISMIKHADEFLNCQQTIVLILMRVRVVISSEIRSLVKADKMWVLPRTQTTKKKNGTTQIFISQSLPKCSRSLKKFELELITVCILQKSPLEQYRLLIKYHHLVQDEELWARNLYKEPKILLP